VEGVLREGWRRGRCAQTAVAAPASAIAAPALLSTGWLREALGLFVAGGFVFFVSHRVEGANRAPHARAFVDADARGGQISLHVGARLEEEAPLGDRVSFDATGDADVAGAQGTEHDSAFFDAHVSLDRHVPLDATGDLEITFAGDVANHHTRGPDRGDLGH